MINPYFRRWIASARLLALPLLLHLQMLSACATADDDPSPIIALKSGTAQNTTIELSTHMKSNLPNAGISSGKGGIYTDDFDQFNSKVWGCEYTCPQISNGMAMFVLKAGVEPNNEGSWSKIQYKPQKFASGKFSVRFSLSARPKQAVWWGGALWGDGLKPDQYNEINFGYTTDESFTNTQLFVESSRLGQTKSVKIDTDVDLYDGRFHEATLEYDENYVSFVFDGKVMTTIEDKQFIPTDPMRFIVGPRLVTGAAPLTQDFAETVDWVRISHATSH